MKGRSRLNRADRNTFRQWPHPGHSRYTANVRCLIGCPNERFVRNYDLHFPSINVRLRVEAKFASMAEVRRLAVIPGPRSEQRESDGLDHRAFLASD